MAFGGFLFGTLADTNGRKSSIPITMVVIFCSSIGISFVQKFFPISLAVFLLGVGFVLSMNYLNFLSTTYPRSTMLLFIL